MSLALNAGQLSLGSASSSQRALSLLRRADLTSHIYVPGANGVSVGGLASNNYLLSDGSTGYSTVDSVDGLMLDGMGAQSTVVALIDTFAFDPAGSTPPTTNSADTYLGVSCVSVTMPANAGGYSVCRGDSRIAGAARHTITAGRFTQYTYTVALSRALTGGESIRIYSTGVMGSSELFVLTSASPASTWIDGASSMVAVTTGTNYPVVMSNAAIASPVTVYLRQYSVREFTGIHATQSTTAKWPIVRRGAYNLLTYSSDLTNAAWAKAGVTATATQLTASGAIAYVYQNLPAFAASTYVLWADVSAGTNSFVNLFVQGTATYWAAAIFDVTNGVVGETRNGAGSGVSVVSSSISLVSAGVYRCVLILNATSNALYPSIGFAPAATGNTFTTNFGEVSGVTVGRTLNVFRSQLELGTTPSDYTPTTAVAASNPSAGKYWLSFDGSNDSLLVGNIGFTNAATIIVAGRVNALSGYQVFLNEDTNGVYFLVNATGGVEFFKTGGATLVASSAGAIVAGVPFVLSVRLSGGVAVIRKNGVQITTAVTAEVFSATTGARIGMNFLGIGYPLNGALGHVIAIPQALTDAECLIEERYVASSFPSAPVF